jgi:hypothetical protein
MLWVTYNGRPLFASRLERAWPMERTGKDSRSGPELSTVPHAVSRPMLQNATRLLVIICASLCGKAVALSLQAGSQSRRGTEKQDLVQSTIGPAWQPPPPLAAHCLLELESDGTLDIHRKFWCLLASRTALPGEMVPPAHLAHACRCARRGCGTSAPREVAKSERKDCNHER